MLNSNIVNAQKPYFTTTEITTQNVPTKAWINSRGQISVFESGVYILCFSFVRNQGGNDTKFMMQLRIDENISSLTDTDPHLSCLSTDWGINSMTYLCNLQAGKTYYIWVRHTASQTHTIDYRCRYAKVK